MEIQAVCNYNPDSHQRADQDLNGPPLRLINVYYVNLAGRFYWAFSARPATPKKPRKYAPASGAVSTRLGPQRRQPHG